MKKFLSVLLVFVVLLSGSTCFASDTVNFLPYDEGIPAEKDLGIVAPEPYYKEPPTTLFSFASDSFNNGPTFKGMSGTSTFVSNAEVELMVDLNNDSYGGTVKFLSQLNLKAEAYDHQVFQIGPQYLHVWKVYCEMTFTHVNPSLNTPLLSIGFKEGVLTSWSPNFYSVGETMTLQNSQSADPSIYMTPVELKAIGLTPSNVNTSKDVAFTFTNVRTLADNGNPGGLVNIDNRGCFKDDWKSEGSFSASGCNEKF
ncbi:hypothetical protein DFR58_11832 [Anaerobacterium chartisolvens]|uniref:Uncharacterized protein n=1 Tax=Anaerobacterium chartisolvens TaxID=1297424 RepID=A0A369B0K2_9FIRM|nr:hypothetical protein [Anaerobacterium chartisolvens]RCX13214.1 hypothetical protein DFR58_11832 [Anaerobacterium chartisolvens]